MKITVKNIMFALPSVFCLTVFSGCMKDIKDGEFSAGSGKVAVTLNLPETDPPLADYSGFKVNMRNRQSGVSYTMYTDAEGKVALPAEYGNYDITVTNKTRDGKIITLWNGAAQGVKLNDETPDQNVTVNMTISVASSLILKEVYFHKTKDLNNTNYGYDQYFTIYNNSDEIEYLDGVGLGIHTEFNSLASPKFTKFWISGSTELRDSVPINAFGFIFPGSGTDYPLEPGEERHIALSAIDHSKTSANLVDLSDPNTVWALYINKFTGQLAPAPGVPKLECYTDIASGSALIISQTSPAVLLYRLDDPYGYVAEGPVPGRKYGNVMYQPTGYTAMPSVMVSTKNIYDGVEFMSNATHNPRLRPEISLKPLFITTTGFSGTSYVRKVDEEATAEAGGRIVYQDTNNSGEDWVMLEHPLLNKYYR